MVSGMGVADSAGEPIFDETDPLVGGDVGVELPPPDLAPVEGLEISPEEDGSVVVDFAPAQTAANPDMAEHGANLAAFLEDGVLTQLGTDIVGMVEADLSSREEWETTMAQGVKLLGVKVEDRTQPFNHACGVYDPVMIEAVIRAQAVARAELLPAKGPVQTEVVGLEDDAANDRAWRIREFMNLYLTKLAPEYYPDYDQMLFGWALFGSVFRKVYFDPVMGRPLSVYVPPENFVVSYTTSDIFTCPRATHIIPMSKNDVKAQVAAGVYRDVNLGDPSSDTSEDDVRPMKQAADTATGVTPELYEGDERYTLYETHLYLTLKGDEAKDGIASPYRVTVDKETKKVLAIYRNWREGDSARRKRQFFVHYKFMPGLGFYGYGFAHILAGAAKTGTSIRRQLVDAGTLNLFPGGLRVKGMRLDDNNLKIGPTTFVEIDTGGLPIQQAIMTMPYKEPPQTSLALLQENTGSAEKIASTTEMAVGEGRQDAPVGTTVALLEAANRVQAATMKRAHEAFSREMEMLYTLFGQHLPESPYPFKVRGGVVNIMRADFDGSVSVFPVSDPNVASSSQRMMRAQALLGMAMQAPQIHDLRAVYRNMYVEMGVSAEKIMQIMPSEGDVQPADPLTENQAMITQKPVKAGEAQDHDAHIAAHQMLVESPAAPAVMAHIAEHQALKMRVKVQEVLGQALPPAGTKLPPQIENQIAVLVAKAMQVIQQQKKAADMEAQGMKPGDPSPAQLMLEQIKVDAQKVMAEAQAAAAKDATARYSADLKARTSIITAGMKANGARRFPAGQM